MSAHLVVALIVSAMAWFVVWRTSRTILETNSDFTPAVFGMVLVAAGFSLVALGLK